MPQQIQPPSHRVSMMQTFPQALSLSHQEQRWATTPVAGAIDFSTDAALAPMSAAAAPTGANTVALAANAAPAAPDTNTAVSSKSPSVGGYTVGTSGAMMHNCVPWCFTGQRALKQAQEWQTVFELGIGATKASKRSQCPLMPHLKVHHYRGEPTGRDYTHDYKNHSTGCHCQFSSRNSQ